MNLMNTTFRLLKNSLEYNIISRNYAFKSDLKIKWVRPEKIPCIRPEKSGDLSGQPDIDKSLPRYEFRNSKELETADEAVRKIFSIEFGANGSKTNVYKQMLADEVRRHDFDDESIEVKIARWTGTIRAMQEYIEKIPRNIKRKIFLHELIDKRKKHLKYLRRWDYKRFEWLLEKLDIVYKPAPDKFYRVTRKESLVKLTDKYCDNIKQERLNAYRLQLEHEKPAFLDEKIRCLHYIKDEEEKYNLEPTVTQAEIDEVKHLREKLQKQIEERQKDAE